MVQFRHDVSNLDLIDGRVNDELEEFWEGDDEFDKYEELEDDFLMIANEGQLAIEEVDADEEEAKKASHPTKPFNYDEADHRNRDIKILTGEDGSEDEEEKALKEYRLAMAALLPEGGQNFSQMFTGQADLDAGFDAFMEEEYDENKIGALHDEEIAPETK